MGVRKCCVNGCESTSNTHCVYHFPRNKTLRQLWMSFLVQHDSSLLLLSDDQLLNKHVCHLHFDKTMFDANGIRMQNSYPCLFTPKEIAHGVPLNHTEYNHMIEHNYCQMTNEERNLPDSSDLILRAGDLASMHSYCKILTQDDDVHMTTNPPVQEPGSSASLLFHVPIQEPRGSVSKPIDQVQENSSEANISKKVSLSKKKMSAKNRRLVCKIKNIAKDSIGESSTSRVQRAHNLCCSELLNDFQKLNKQTKTFILMQLKAIRNNKMSRRYNLDEKLLSLTILKQGPKNYKLLKHMFALPTKRTLDRMSRKIVFETGINNEIFTVIKEKVKKWNREKKLCSVVFDEVSITPGLTFSEDKDVIHGFCDIAGERKIKYCDHALVFMVRGICSSWRQPLAYYFCEGTIAAAELKKIIKQIVEKVGQCGLLPLALVSDQGSTFRTAYKQFREETMQQRIKDGVSDDGTIHISGYDLSIVYDPPHLLKGIRNNLLTKDMIFDSKIATWKDIMTIYDLDNTLGHTRAMPKLTKHHVDNATMRKMRVSVAAQVLSARVAAMLRYTDAVVKRRDGEPMSSTMATTADVVEFFDKLFDSVNGRPGDGVKGKLRTAVKLNSAHLSFWNEAIRKLNSVRFMDKNGKRASVPSIQGWITTLKSFTHISKLLFSKYEVNYFYPRLINQDPLENFFGRVRASNYRNVNPDANSFIYTFKSLVLSSILSPLSKFSNCEEDEGEQLVSLELLFKNESREQDKENIPQNLINSPGRSGSVETVVSSLPPVVAEKIKVQCSAYTAGYVCRKILKNNNCTRCEKTLKTENITAIHKYIQFREYKSLKNNNLKYPTEKFLITYRQTSEFIHNYLKQFCHEKNVGATLNRMLLSKIDLDWMGCNNHNRSLKLLFVKTIIRLQVHNWVKNINKILRGGIDAKYVSKCNEPQVKALNKFKIRRKFKNKLKKN